jgi:hypothetical protein
MNIDPYTRLVLTVIACCLLWICVREVGVANAAPEAVDVRIVGIETKDPLRVETGPATPIQVESAPLTLVNVRIR